MAVLRAADPALQTFLSSVNEFAIADLYTFTLVTGAVFRLTNWDTNLTVGGLFFNAAGSNPTTGEALVSRSAVKTSNDLSVDNMTVTLAGTINMLITISAPSATPVQQMSIPQAAAGGWLRAAKVLVQKLILPYQAGVPVVQFNPIWWFSGKVGQAEFDPLTVKLTCNSDLYILDNYLPRAVIQSGCRWTLYDQGCTLTQATFGLNNTATGGSTGLLIIPASSFGSAPFGQNANASGYFDQGKIMFTSGANNQITRTIKQQLAPNLYLRDAFPFPINSGDAFTAFAGCDRLQNTCSVKFNNLANFGGMPFVPNPEVAL